MAQMSPGENRPRRRRWPWIVLAVLIAIPLALWIALQPLARWGTRKGLANLKDFSSEFKDVHVDLFPLRYEITELKLTEQPAKKDDPPLWYSKRVQAEISFLSLLRGHVIGSLRVESPKISYVVRKPVTQEVKETKEKLRDPISNIIDQISKLPPARVDRVEVLDAELLLEDRREEGNPSVYMHNLDITVDNLASNRDLSRERATIVAVSGTLQRSGSFSIFLSADPITLPPRFAGRFHVADLQLQDFHGLMKAKAGVTIPKGIIEVYSSFRADEGRINGGVKPVLSHLDAAPADESLGSKIKAGLADAAIKIFESKDEDKKIGTVVPIRGSLDSPNVQVWPTILGVIRNAFVEAVARSFDNTPPPVAGRKQGPIKQAVEALKRGSGSPKAQPVEGKQ